MEDVEKYKSLAEEKEQRGRSMVDDAKSVEDLETGLRVLESSLPLWKLFLSHAPDYLVTLYEEHVQDIKSFLDKKRSASSKVAPVGPIGERLSQGDQVLESDTDIERWIEIDDIDPGACLKNLKGLEEAVAELRQNVTYPYRGGTEAEILKRKISRGILLFGPPGCGKTKLVEALVNELGKMALKPSLIKADFAAIMSKFRGEAERNVKELFRKARERARTNVPCIVFIDEIEALVEEREESPKSTRSTGGVLSQFLVELSNLKLPNSSDIYVIGATNRPDRIDPALTRPGRLGVHIRVDLPNKEARREIFAHYLGTEDVKVNVNVDQLADLTDGFSGAEIEGACEMAIVKYLVDRIDGARQDDYVSDTDLVETIERVSRGEKEVLDFANEYGKFMQEKISKLLKCAEKCREILDWKDSGGIASLKVSS